MNRIKLYALAIIAGACVLACGGQSESSQTDTNEDQSMLDAAVEARLEAEAQAKAKADRLEAERRDSLDKIDEFISKLPTFTKMYSKYNSGELGDYLTQLGFKKNVKITKTELSPGISVDGQIATYTLFLDNKHYCKITEDGGYEWYFVEYELVGAPERLAADKEAAKRARLNLEDPDMEYIEIKGNTISWGDGH